MKQTVNLSDFRTAFHQMNRGDQFTHAGLSVLFDYFEELEEDMGEEIEFDVIAICCEYAESEPRTIAEDYRIDVRGLDDEETAEAVREFLEDEGVLVGETDSTIVYRQF
jgi:predicted ArsR family transcriptional regulator